MVTSPLIYIIALIIIYELTVTIYNNNSSSNLPAKMCWLIGSIVNQVSVEKQTGLDSRVLF